MQSPLLLVRSMANGAVLLPSSTMGASDREAHAAVTTVRLLILPPRVALGQEQHMGIFPF